MAIPPEVCRYRNIKERFSMESVKRDLSGSRHLEREYVFDKLPMDGHGQMVLDIGPGPKARACEECIRRGYNVVAVDLRGIIDGFPRLVYDMEAIMTYSLKGDRKVEWGYVKQNLPEGDGFLLDIGPSPTNPKPARVALSRGYQVVAVGLQRPELAHQKFTFIHGDFLEVNIPWTFDWIINISTIEHFGLAGRYGITENNPDADLLGMRRARALMKPNAKMLLTIPVGVDSVMGFLHRVYGKVRLPRLLRGYRVLEKLYWAKFNDEDIFVSTDEETALSTIPTINSSYYALGAYTLSVE